MMSYLEYARELKSKATYNILDELDMALYELSSNDSMRHMTIEQRHLIEGVIDIVAELRERDIL